MNDTIENGKISSTLFGIEDHGLLTFVVFVIAGSSGQGVGGYQLAAPRHPEWDNKIAFTAIYKLLNVVGVDRWENLTGQLIRIKWRHNRQPVIGNILEDKWWDIEQEMKGASGE